MTSDSSSSFRSRLPQLAQAFEQAGERRSCRKNEVIFKAGEPGDAMYYILSGEVELLFEGDKPGKRLGAGELFGELALLLGDRPRTGTAIVTADCELRRLDQKSHEQLIQTSPHELFHLFQYICTYLLSSEQQLVSSLREQNRQLRQAMDFLHRTREELSLKETQALTDELTGLYNRRCFSNHIEGYAKRIDQGGEDALTLLMLDLDGFKGVNDTLGHAMGDQLLVAVAESIRNAVRQEDLPCRLGGDEFAVIVPRATAEVSVALGRRLCEQVAHCAEHLREHGLRVTTSIGGGRYRGGEGVEPFIARVDRALYRAKQRGRDRSVWDV